MFWKKKPPQPVATVPATINPATLEEINSLLRDARILNRIMWLSQKRGTFCVYMDYTTTSEGLKLREDTTEVPSRLSYAFSEVLYQFATTQSDRIRARLEALGYTTTK